MADHRGGQSRSGATSLSSEERAEIAAVASALPTSWCISLSAYTGQLSMHPTLYVPLLGRFVRGGERSSEGWRMRRHSAEIPA